ncbi:MAG: efflux RND transporter periplasmic adaptor subunit [Bacteroidales bacterium]|nr:efflux RND transporter periplasmic adaptor subunit [Bacteroidales bacterium]
MIMQSSCHTGGSSTGENDTFIQGNEVTVTGDQFRAAGMMLGNMEKVLFENAIRLNGMISVPPEYKAGVSIIMPGFVRRIPVVEGEFVHEGETVLELANTDYIQLQQDYLEAFYSLNYLRSEYERQKSLIGDNITSQKNYLSAESEYDKMLAIYEGLTEKLRLINIDPGNVEKGKITSVIRIPAPITGYITTQKAYLGMFLESHDIIVEIIDTRNLQLKLSAFEKDVLHIQPGQLIRYRNVDAPDEWHVASVRIVGKSVDPETRTIPVYGRIEEEDKEVYLDGMYVEAEIITQDREAYGLPNESIQKEEDKFFIFAKKDEGDDEIFFERRYVTVGQVSETHTEIITDTALTEILVKGAPNLKIESSIQ